MTNECRDLNEFEKKASMLLKNVRKIGKFREKSFEGHNKH